MDLTKLKADVAAQLKVGGTHLAQRLDRLTKQLADHLEAKLKCDASQAYTAAVEQLGSLSLREVCLLLAEGPTEQTNALAPPEPPAEETQPAAEAQA